MTFFLSKNVITESWSAYTTPPELKNATFITVKDNNPIASRVNSYKYSKIQHNVGDIVMFSNDENNVLAVRQSGQESVLEFNGVEMVRNVLPIATPSLSPDSNTLLYSQSIQTETKSNNIKSQGMIATDPSLYEIRAVFSSTKNDTRVISGYAPNFINDNEFVFLASSGIYLYNKQSGTGKILLEKNFSTVFGPVLQSPDRSLIAFADTSRKVTAVYRIKDSSVELVFETTSILIKPALSDTALYDMKATEHGSEIWKYDFGVSEPQLIHTIPRSLGLNRIVF
jgi:hypothetical protein